MIDITITIDPTTMIDMIVMIATTAVTALATCTHDNTGIAAIATSLTAILKRLMMPSKSQGKAQHHVQ